MDFLSFCHYSDKDLEPLLSFSPEETKRADLTEEKKDKGEDAPESAEERALRLLGSTSSKPRKGYWFARGDEWIDWCKDSGFFPHHYRYKYAFRELRDQTRVLIIRDVKEAREFEAKFGVNPFSRLFSGDSSGGLMTELKRIDWDQVEKEYDAVYLPLLDYGERRGLSILWSTLDVDSLVVFELDNVALRLLEHREEGWIKSDNNN